LICKTDVSIEKDGKLKYAETMLVYEMGVFPLFDKLFNETCPITNYAPYDGDTVITEDKYGDPLRERSLDEMIDFLDWYITMNDDSNIYVRVRPLIALLNEYQKIQNNRYQLAILHYGH
jgi:hypothetical protein